MTSTQSPRSRRHFALLGGFRYQGETPPPEAILCVAAVGGADIDLTREPLPAVTQITKVSLVGGVKLRVPADAEVEVSSLHIVGGRPPVPPAVSSDHPKTVVRVKSYGLFGGVNVRRDPAV